MVYPDKNKRYVKIRKNHRNYLEEQKRERRLRIGIAVGVGVLALGLVIGFRVPGRMISAVQKQSERSAEQKAEAQAVKEAEEKKAEAQAKKQAEKEAAAKKEAEKKAASEKKKEKAAKKDKNTDILFTGDVLFNDATQSNYDKDGIDGVVEKDLKNMLKEADIFEMNHEFVLTGRGTPADKDAVYSIDPKYVEIEKKMGVDVCALANNHLLDFGPDGVADTLFSLNSSKIKHAGGGEKYKDASAFVKIKKNGKTFGFVSAVHDLPDPSWDVRSNSPGVFCFEDPSDLYEAIGKAKESCDYVFALVHWGAQDTTDLEDYEGDVARAIIDAGADGVVGSHPHVLQTIDFYEGKPIFYSLGNFIFGDVIDQGACASVTIKKNGSMKVKLVPVYAEGAQTKLAPDDRAGEIYDSIKKISPGIKISEDGVVSHD